MCYFLYLASPLTLSEVRSMLPSWLTADLAPFHEQQTLKALHPQAQTVAGILVGRCSCDLVRPREANSREDERHLRERYRRLEVPRDGIIAALERHRRGTGVEPAGGSSRAELARFVAEHARNAGPTLYYLFFSPERALPPAAAGVRKVGTQLVSERLGEWLDEGIPTLVSR